MGPRAAESFGHKATTPNTIKNMRYRGVTLYLYRDCYVPLAILTIGWCVNPSLRSYRFPIRASF